MPQVFDTRDNAMLYKSQCRQRLQEAGTLITMDGWKVAASGLLEKLPDDCPVVFGEMPVTKTKSYRVGSLSKTRLQGSP